MQWRAPPLELHPRPPRQTRRWEQQPAQRRTPTPQHQQEQPASRSYWRTADFPQHGARKPDIHPPAASAAAPSPPAVSQGPGYAMRKGNRATWRHPKNNTTLHGANQVSSEDRRLLAGHRRAIFAHRIASAATWQMRARELDLSSWVRPKLGPTIRSDPARDSSDPARKIVRVMSSCVHDVSSINLTHLKWLDLKACAVSTRIEVSVMDVSSLHVASAFPTACGCWASFCGGHGGVF